MLFNRPTSQIVFENVVRSGEKLPGQHLVAILIH